MKQPLMWHLTLPFFIWICSCQGSAPEDHRKTNSTAIGQEQAKGADSKRSRTEIDEVPANLKANLKGYDVFSCVQKGDASSTSTGIELCFEVSRSHVGNDDTAIQFAQGLCGHNLWQVGKSCPKSGIVSACKGAVMNSGLTYDKFGYVKGISINDECQANGGQQIAVVK